MRNDFFLVAVLFFSALAHGEAPSVTISGYYGVPPQQIARACPGFPINPKQVLVAAACARDLFDIWITQDNHVSDVKYYDTSACPSQPTSQGIAILTFPNPIPAGNYLPIYLAEAITPSEGSYSVYNVPGPSFSFLLYRGVSASPSCNVPLPTLNPALLYSGRLTLGRGALVTGEDQGGSPRVRFGNPLVGLTAGFDAYDSNFAGGVRVAMGDITGDGVAEIVTAAGPGGGPHVRVIDGATGQALPGAAGGFFAYSAFFTGGVYVALGDVNCDGRLDVITAAGEGGGPHVRAFDGLTHQEVKSFYAYSANFAGGVRVAAADVDGDHCDDIITAAGPGGGPHVRVFSGRTQQVITEFYAYSPLFTGGVYVAAGDVNGDGKADIVTGAGQGGGPHVRVFSVDSNRVAQSVREFFAFEASFTGGVRVGVSDLNGDGKAEILTARGPGRTPEVRVWDGATPSLFTLFHAFGSAFTGGVYLGGLR